MIFVVSPYRHEIKEIEEQRVVLAENYVSKLIIEGKIPFSAVVYAHSLIKKHKLPTDIDYWKSFICSFLRDADEVHVLKIDGWNNSEGIDWEISVAKSLRIPIIYVEVP